MDKEKGGHSSINILRTAGLAETEFDPKSFIRIFDLALRDVNKIRGELEERIKALEDEKETCEAVHRTEVKEIKSEFSNIGERMEALEYNMSRIVGNTVRVGEQLDIISREKSRAEEINELIVFFSDLSEDKVDRLNELLGSGLEGQMKAALVLRRLLSISADNELVSQTNNTGRVHIQKYAEEFENFVMKQFHDAYENNNIQLMAIAASILDAFNGGKSVIKAYINQHPFFLESISNEVQGHIDEITSQTINTAEKPDSASPLADRWLVQLLESTYRLIRDEWTTISQIFPRPIIVMKRFIRRIFEETIQGYLSRLLLKVREHSSLSYLRILASSHAATSRIVDRIKLFDSQVVSPTVSAIETARRICGTGNDYTHRTLGLGKQFSSPLFNQNIGGGKKGDEDTMVIREISVALSGGQDRGWGAGGEDRDSSKAKKGARSDGGRGGDGSSGASSGILHATLDQCLDELFVSYTDGGKYIRDEQAYFSDTLRSLLDEMTKVKARVGNAPESKATSLFSSMWSATGAPIVQVPHSRGQMDSRERTQFRFDDEFVEFTRGLVVRVFKVHAESVSRTVEVVKRSSIMERSLKDTRQAPNTDIFKLIQVINQATTLIQVHFQRVMAPLLSDTHTAYQDLVGIKNSVMFRLESDVNSLVVKLVQVSIQWVTHVLGKQKKSDFKPSEDDIMALSNITEPCKECTEFLDQFGQRATECLDRPNRTRVLNELGKAMYHDVSRYRQSIERFGIPELTQCFTDLWELAKIYMVNADSLKSLLNEGIPPAIDKATLRKFVQMREDYRSVDLGKLVE
ncbi:Exocyst complex component 5 [Spiromyces aspiralis]|uniref:Exocyst complex component 5 n=1 Tax=Spiromyces aspiralis TaxID=68401 RepID=A0ACC1I1C3_9FUNG|nr:Exocyst complex component 5 [Spiromyces aspiralis]